MKPTKPTYDANGRMTQHGIRANWAFWAIFILILVVAKLAVEGSWVLPVIGGVAFAGVAVWAFVTRKKPPPTR
jgi:hypothetical protein